VAPLDVDLVAPDRTVWKGEARMVTAPAADGQMGILQGHSPVLAILRPGNVTIRPTTGEAFEAHVTGGFLSVDSDVVTIVVDPLELGESPSGAAR